MKNVLQIICIVWPIPQRPNRKFSHFKTWSQEILLSSKMTWPPNLSSHYLVFNFLTTQLMNVLLHDSLFIKATVCNLKKITRNVPIQKRKDISSKSFNPSKRIREFQLLPLANVVVHLISCNYKRSTTWNTGQRWQSVAEHGEGR